MYRMKTGIVIGLCFAMLMAGFAVQSVKAADVENQWLIEIPGAPPAATFMDVAWSSDGKVAVFVGSETGKAQAYMYYPETNTWLAANNIGVTPAATTFRTVEFLSNSFKGPMFMMFGVSGSGGAYWSIQPQANNTIYEATGGGPLVNADIYGSCIDFKWQRVIVAGSKMGAGAFAAAYNYTNPAWTAVNSNGNASLNMIWYDVATIANNDVPDVALVGANKLDGNNLYNIVNFTDGMAVDRSIGGQQGAFTGVTYDTINKRLIMTTAMRAGGIRQPALYAAEKSTSFQNFVPISNSVGWAEDLWGIDMVSGRAIAVGKNMTANTAIVYDVVVSGASTSMYLQSNSSALFTGKNFTGVSIRPSGIPMALFSGSAFKYSYINSESSIVVNTVYPHINYIDLVNQGINSSIMNSVTNVDIGDNSVTYNLTIGGSYTAPGGASLISMIDVWMWFDGGATGLDMSGLVDTGTPNMGAHFVWYSTGPGTSGMVFPTTSEWDFVGHEQSVETLGGQNFIVSFMFRPNQQVRNATSAGDWNSGGFAVPGRYGGAALGAQTTLGSLDDPDSWDIKVTATDNASLASGDAFDEFGLNRFWYIGAGASLPGNGFLSGSGAPGQTVILVPAANQNVTFNANCYYDLRIWSTDLTGPSGTISAGQLDVMGGQIAFYGPMAGSGELNAIYLIGGIGNAVYGLPGWYGVTNTTWNAPNGGNSFAMRCRIPGGTPEDTYTGTLTYSLTPDV